MSIKSEGKLKVILLLIVVIIFFVVGFFSWHYFSSSNLTRISSNLKSTAERLAIIPAQYNPSSLYFSHDGKKFAYRVKEGYQEFVIAGNDVGQKYDQVYIPIWSPDDTKLGYLAKKEGRYEVIVNGKEGKPYDEIALAFNLFSNDSNQWAYTARKGNNWFIVIENENSSRAEKPYANAGGFIFSPDSRHLAYIATHDNKHFFVVFDGQEGGSYDFVDKLVFSPDSTKLAYHAIKGNKNFVVVNDKEIASYDDLGYNSPIFNSQGQLAYAARRENTDFIVIDGKEGPHYEFGGLITTDFVFSPNGKKVTYLAYKNQYSKRVFVINDKEIQVKDSYDLVGYPVFSPDGNLIAYKVVQRKENNQFYVILSKDGYIHEGKRYNLVDGLIFSHDSKKWVYRASIEQTKDLRKELIVVGDREDKVYDRIYRFEFSLDSQNLIYIVKLNNEIWQMVEPSK